MLFQFWASVAQDESGRNDIGSRSLVFSGPFFVLLNRDIVDYTISTSTEKLVDVLGHQASRFYVLTGQSSMLVRCSHNL